MLIIPQLGFPEFDRQTVERNAEFSSFVSHLSLLGPVLVRGTAVSSSLNLITQLTQSHQTISTSDSRAVPLYVDGLELGEEACATTLLNQGVGVVFFLRRMGVEQAASRLSVLQSFPRSRVGVSMRVTMGPGAQAVSEALEAVTAMVDETGTVAEHLLLDMIMSAVSDIVAFLVAIKEMLDIHRIHRRAAVQIYICVPSSAMLSNEMVETITAMQLNGIHLCVLPVLVPASDAALEPTLQNAVAHRMISSKIVRSPYLETDKGLVDLLHAYISVLRSDRKDGLFATVVCDSHGVCLGLVYSNTDSIRIAFMQRKGVYYSRSAGKVWYKGASSGLTQELLSIRIDCDSDALQFKVLQRGTNTHFCHMLTHTCWGDLSGMAQLERSILDRKRYAAAGSFTNKLLGNKELLNDKLIEQVEELTEVVEKEDIAEEASKVLYFLLTKCVAEDVSFASVINKLDARAGQITRQTAVNSSNASVLTPNTKISQLGSRI